MKNKIHKYDFLIVGSGLIGAIAALALVKKKIKVLVIDKKNNIPKDNRTLAVNANSIDFLKYLETSPLIPMYEKMDPNQYILQDLLMENFLEPSCL